MFKLINLLSKYLRQNRSIHKRSEVCVVKMGIIIHMWTLHSFYFTDLATYDTAKHKILKHTDLKDNHITHAMARYFSSVYFM